MTVTQNHKNAIRGGIPDIAAANKVINAAEVCDASSASFSPAASTSNVCLVTIQVKDSLGNNVQGAQVLDVYLSDSATGAGITGTAASGAVGAGASGTDLGVLVAKKWTKVKTTAAGVYILSITDSAKMTFYVAALFPNGALSVSSQLTTGNYG